MCGRCDGEPYRGVTALFNGDLQALMGSIDRKDWLAVSGNVILHIGKSALTNASNYLVWDCDVGYYGLLGSEERSELESISADLSRPLRAPDPDR